jgi:hypothetical protein
MSKTRLTVLSNLVNFNYPSRQTLIIRCKLKPFGLSPKSTDFHGVQECSNSKSADQTACLPGIMKTPVERGKSIVTRTENQPDSRLESDPSSPLSHKAKQKGEMIHSIIISVNLIRIIKGQQHLKKHNQSPIKDSLCR